MDKNVFEFDLDDWITVLGKPDDWKVLPIMGLPVLVQEEFKLGILCLTRTLYHKRIVQPESESSDKEVRTVISVPYIVYKSFSDKYCNRAHIRATLDQAIVRLIEQKLFPSNTVWLD